MTEPHEIFANISAYRLAKVYATALLNAAEAAQAVTLVIEEIDSLVVDVLRSDSRLEALLAGAAIGRYSRRDAIIKAFAGRASATFQNFMQVLNDHDRLDLIRPIRSALHEINDERTRRLRVIVQSAVELTEDFQNDIRNRVRARFNLEPVLDLRVDPSLLGGLKIRIGDKVYDATIRARIENLRNQLIASSSHEIQTRRDRFSSAE